MYRKLPIDRAKAEAAIDASDRHFGKCLLFSFLAIFLHSITLNGASIVILGIELPVENDYVIKGTLCFLALFYGSLTFYKVHEAAISGHSYSATDRQVRYYIYKIANNKSTRERFHKSALQKSYFPIYVKKRARLHIGFVFCIPVLIALFSVLVCALGIVISLDDLFRMVSEIFGALTGP